MSARNANAHNPDGKPEGRPADFSIRDVTLVVVAVVGIIFANVGVVRALDIALDAIHRR